MNGDPEQELLTTLRRVMSPTLADQERVSIRLSAQLAAGAIGLSASTDPLPASGAATAPTLTGLRGLGTQLIAAGLIGTAGFGGGYLAGRSATPVAPKASEPVVAAAAAVSVTRPVPSIVELSELSPAPAASVPKPPALVSATSDQTLTEEAREVRRVDRALRSQMPVLALSLLNDLDSRIPHGALGEERAAARLMARCMTSDPDATAAASSWLRTHPRSVYAPRLRESCPFAGGPSGESPAKDGKEPRGE
jgi:hypothetical protein